MRNVKQIWNDWVMGLFDGPEEPEEEDTRRQLTRRADRESDASRLIPLIEGGVVGGLRKCQKWDMIPDTTDAIELEIVNLITGYVLANIEEEFDLDPEDEWGAVSAAVTRVWLP